MNDLIKITKTKIGTDNINSVNSREIYEYLEIDTKYNDWINRAIEKYDFEENIDYSKMSNGTARGIDYIVSMDMAKELCMVSNTQKGKETRKYFIHVEKQAISQISIPQNPMEALELFFDVSKKQESRILKLEETKKLEYWQEKALQDAKNQKVYSIADDDKKLASALHRKIWSLFKKKFHLPRYNELPAIRHQEGLEYIRNLTLADMV